MRQHLLKYRKLQKSSKLISSYLPFITFTLAAKASIPRSLNHSTERMIQKFQTSYSYIYKSLLTNFNTSLTNFRITLLSCYISYNYQMSLISSFHLNKGSYADPSSIAQYTLIINSYHWSRLSVFATSG